MTGHCHVCGLFSFLCDGYCPKCHPVLKLHRERERLDYKVPKTRLGRVVDTIKGWGWFW